MGHQVRFKLELSILLPVEYGAQDEALVLLVALGVQIFLGFFIYVEIGPGRWHPSLISLALVLHSHFANAKHGKSQWKKKNEKGRELKDHKDSNLGQHPGSRPSLCAL